MTKAKLTLIGAGPGDPELISIKGAKALSSADVVLYDALTHPDLLKYAPAHSIKIFVGKRAGEYAFSQEEIHDLIVHHALKHGHVVRLKGGDPFIFGRGHEELIHAKTFNIPIEVIPGISSSISVPELQLIPLTRRGVNESFWVITGTTSTGEISEDIALAAKSSATVVILMGMNNLERIMDLFKKEHKGETPVAIIQNGSLPNEKIGLGTVNSIQDVVKAQSLGSPAIIVVGEVVRLHPDYVLEHADKKQTPEIADKAKSGAKNFLQRILGIK
jgi:uroporphyrin-III C-methyltransferase